MKIFTLYTPECWAFTLHIDRHGASFSIGPWAVFIQPVKS